VVGEMSLVAQTLVARDFAVRMDLGEDKLGPDIHLVVPPYLLLLRFSIAFVTFYLYCNGARRFVVALKSSILYCSWGRLSMETVQSIPKFRTLKFGLRSFKEHVAKKVLPT
jgi:hypothetical protein